MKAYHPILILVVRLGGVILSGCATSPRHPVAVQPALARTENPDGVSDDSMAGDSPDNSSVARAIRKPWPITPPGISYEWNDEDEMAVQQFDDAALADPATSNWSSKWRSVTSKTKRRTRP